jgi:[acyl-carrier-protein] S-malonyltransferase
MNDSRTSFIALFPGQGSQAVGMGRELAAAEPEARRTFEEADDALGEALSTLCFEGPEESLRLTRNTQPALLTVSVAAWRVLTAKTAARPAAAAGHSLGEYSALVAAGALDFPDALRAVRLRGEAMQEAVPVGEGAMAALVGLDQFSVEELCASTRSGDEVLVPANVNAPDQIVVAGHKAPVERIVERAGEAGAKRAVPLPVSAPFHTPLMRPAAERLALFLADLRFQTPSFPVVANVDARPVHEGDEARRKLVEQVASPVRWVETMRYAEGELGLALGVELGVGRVLAGLARRTSRGLKVLPAGTPEELERAVERLEEA